MDKRTNGVSGNQERPPPAAEAARLEEHIESTRDHLYSLVGELDRRRRRAAPIAWVGLGAVGVAATGVAIWVARRRNRRATKVSRIGRALRRVWTHPDRIAKPVPGAARKILIAAASAAASLAVRRLAQRLRLFAPTAASGRGDASPLAT